MITARVELAGFPSKPSRSSAEVTVPDEATVRDVVLALREQHPDLPELRQVAPEQLVVAVNDSMVTRLDQPLAKNNDGGARVSVMLIRLIPGG